MCGISGAFAFAADARFERSKVDVLNELQRRRGPDGEGSWAADDGRVAFGHRRLAIIDPGPGGAQPMHDREGRYVITYNGEIYNYRELRAELEAQGRKFHSDCDTE